MQLDVPVNLVQKNKGDLISYRKKQVYVMHRHMQRKFVRR